MSQGHEQKLIAPVAQASDSRIGQPKQQVAFQCQFINRRTRSRFLWLWRKMAARKPTGTFSPMQRDAV